MHPKISVIIPVYNVKEYIHACIDSILAQTFTDFELILVDDCSTDGTAQIIEEYRARMRGYALSALKRIPGRALHETSALITQAASIFPS